MKGERPGERWSAGEGVVEGDRVVGEGELECESSKLWLVGLLVAQDCHRIKKSRRDGMWRQCRDWRIGRVYLRWRCSPEQVGTGGIPTAQYGRPSLVGS